MRRSCGPLVSRASAIQLTPLELFLSSHVIPRLVRNAERLTGRIRRGHVDVGHDEAKQAEDNCCTDRPSEYAQDVGRERDSHGDYNDPHKAHQHDGTHALTMLASWSRWQRTNTEAPTESFHIGLARMCP